MDKITGEQRVSVRSTEKLSSVDSNKSNFTMKRKKKLNKKYLSTFDFDTSPTARQKTV